MLRHLGHADGRWPLGHGLVSQVSFAEDSHAFEAEAELLSLTRSRDKLCNEEMVSSETEIEAETRLAMKRWHLQV